MRAARIHRFGGPEVLIVEDVGQPVPNEGEILVRVKAAGVGPWDALIREGKSKVSPEPPLTLGSDLSGVVAAIGRGVTGFREGEEAYGVTNPQFCGAQAEYAVARAKMMARKPGRLTHVEAASVPVVAVTAWQMLFEYAKAQAGQSVLILGAAGSVGAYATQLAVRSGLRVTALVRAQEAAFAKSLGAHTIVSSETADLEKNTPQVDVVIDTVGGETLHRASEKVRAGGTLVSVVSTDTLPQRAGVNSVFFYVEVSTERLERISEWFADGKLVSNVGEVLPLEKIRDAHDMLGGMPHKRGKIVLDLMVTA